MKADPAVKLLLENQDRRLRELEQRRPAPLDLYRTCPLGAEDVFGNSAQLYLAPVHLPARMQLSSIYVSARSTSGSTRVQLGIYRATIPLNVPPTSSGIFYSSVAELTSMLRTSWVLLRDSPPVVIDDASYARVRWTMPTELSLDPEAGPYAIGWVGSSSTLRLATNLADGPNELGFPANDIPVFGALPQIARGIGGPIHVPSFTLLSKRGTLTLGK